MTTRLEQGDTMQEARRRNVDCSADFVCRLMDLMPFRRRRKERREVGGGLMMMMCIIIIATMIIIIMMIAKCRLYSCSTLLYCATSRKGGRNAQLHRFPAAAANSVSSDDDVLLCCWK